MREYMQEKKGYFVGSELRPREYRGVNCLLNDISFSFLITKTAECFKVWELKP